MERFLYCIPLTGLYDTLCQIAHCWSYAERFNRTLVIDTRLSGLNCCFWDAFEFRSSISEVNVVKPTSRLARSTKELPTLPTSLNGRTSINRDEIGWIDGADRLKVTREKVKVDLNKDYTVPKLFHICRGGGTAGFDMLSKITLNDKTKEEVAQRTNYLPEKYIAIHIRNTDATSSYLKYLRKLQNEIAGHNVVVCSDSQSVVDFAKDFFTSNYVFSTSIQRSTDGKPLHAGTEARKRGRSVTVDALVDLAALSNAATIHSPPVQMGLGRSPSKIAKNLIRVLLGRRRLNRVSGFTSLAQFLQRNKDIRHQFFGIALR